MPFLVCDRQARSTVDATWSTGPQAWGSDRFAKSTWCRLKNGVFHSVGDLQAAINRFIREYNADSPKPFIWKANPDDIRAPLVLAEIGRRLPWLSHVFADGGYGGEKLRDALRRIGKWTVEIIKRSDAAKGSRSFPGAESSSGRWLGSI